MRDFFVRAYGIAINILVVVAMIFVVVVSFQALSGFVPGIGRVGFVGGLLIFALGSAMVVLAAGTAYTLLAIAENTRRTADAVERMANK